MAIIKNTTYSGQTNTSTLDGSIRLEQGTGRIVINDSTTTKELNVVDRTGYLFSDGTNRRIKLGAAPSDGRVGFWLSKSGKDVINEMS